MSEILDVYDTEIVGEIKSKGDFLLALDDLSSLEEIKQDLMLRIRKCKPGSLHQQKLDKAKLDVTRLQHTVKRHFLDYYYQTDSLKAANAELKAEVERLRHLLDCAGRL